MYQSPSPAPLLPPPERLLLCEDFLTVRGQVDWLMCPWMSERTRDLVLPMQVLGERFLLCLDGLAVVRLEGDGTFRLQGRTGAFGSALTIQREGPRTTFKGFLDDQTVDYVVEEEGDTLRVDGDTGRFRSRYAIKFQGEEALLEGDHGEFDSHFSARAEPDGSLRAEGVRSGERIDLSVRREGTDYRFEGPFLGGHSEFTLAAEDRKWTLSGHVAGDRLQVAMSLVEDGLDVSGALPTRLVRYRVFRTEDGYWIRGKSGDFHLNYRLLTRRET